MLHADKERVARRRNRFDDRNLLVETTFFDVNDKPTHDQRGAVAIHFKYDESGKKTGESAVDQSGRAILTDPNFLTPRE
jgi:hypothetical protein